MTKQNIMTIAAVTAVSMIGSVAFAGPAPAKPAKEVKAPAPESCVSGNFGLDITDHYYWHGLLQQGESLILQPYANLSLKVAEGGAFDSVSVDLGIWNSFHGNRGGRANQNNNWFEFDFTAGLTLTKGNWTISPKYIRYSSPADAFSNAGAVALSIGYNDKDLLGDWALSPYLWVEYEADGRSGGGTGGGLYWELGISPSRQITEDLSVSLPIKVGLGTNDYYAGDDAYGFAQVGIQANYALRFVPECLGDWSASAGFHYINLGDAGEATNAGDDSDYFWTGGLRCQF